MPAKDSRKEPEHWEVLESREIYASAPWIRVLQEKVKLPDGRIVDDYHRIDLPDFVIVYPELPDGRVLVERQYKHGPRHMVLTLPAGAIDPGEAPLAAARRELLEETGYSAPEWHALGSYTANGNYGCGCAHIFLARGCTRTAEPTSEDLEHTTLLQLTGEELLRSATGGRVELIGNVAAVMLAAAKLREL